MVETIPEDLKDFAFCHNDKYAELTRLAAPEYWGPDNSILLSYMRNLYQRIASLYNAQIEAGRNNGLKADQSVLLISDTTACFNTGLYTELLEKIYALFMPNTRDDARQEWYLSGFYKESDVKLEMLTELPDKVRFYDDTADLIFDSRLDIRSNVDHILKTEENFERLPEDVKKMKENTRRLLLSAAIDDAKKRAEANYMLAVPQYYNGRIQLLLPLSFTEEKAQLALTLERKDGFYSARTCLTVDMAYNNARLLARPEAAWIQECIDTDNTLEKGKR